MYKIRYERRRYKFIDRDSAQTKYRPCHWSTQSRWMWDAHYANMACARTSVKSAAKTRSVSTNAQRSLARNARGDIYAFTCDAYLNARHAALIYFAYTVKSLSIVNYATARNFAHTPAVDTNALSVVTCPLTKHGNGRTSSCHQQSFQRPKQ